MNYEILGDVVLASKGIWYKLKSFEIFAGKLGVYIHTLLVPNKQKMVYINYINGQLKTCIGCGISKTFR